MEGFFSLEELRSPVVHKGGCPSCGLDISTMLEPTGEGKRGILIVAEAMGQTEHEKGIQLIGKVGQRLRRTLREIGDKLKLPDGLDLDRDFRKTNSIACFPGQGVAPEEHQINICRKRVFQEIENFKPRVVIALGSPAVQSLIGGRWNHDKKYMIGRWRQFTIPDHDLGAWLCPTFHPSYVARNEYNPSIDLIWRQDLTRAIKLATTPLPPKLKPEIIKLWDEESINKMLLQFWKTGKEADWSRIGGSKKPLTLFMDFETTGKKPYSPLQKIMSCALSDHPSRAYAWMWETMSKRSKALFRSLMENPNIRKGGANNPFEHNWLRCKEGYEIQGWWWDCNLDAHILDNRPFNANVKLQVYTRLGIQDYDSDVAPFLKSVGSDKSNGLNRIEHVDPERLLEYNGNDSALEFGVALSQRKDFGYEDSGPED